MQPQREGEQDTEYMQNFGGITSCKTTTQKNLKEWGITVDIKEIDSEDWRWMEPTQDNVQWWASVLALWNFQRLLPRTQSFIFGLDTRSRLAVGSIQLPAKQVPDVLIPEAKQSGYEPEYSSPLSAKIKNACEEWRYTPLTSCMSSWHGT